MKILLLVTFVYWATGMAKHVHKAVERHGRDASVDDDDDDDGGLVSVASPSSAMLVPLKQAADPKHKHPCPICQMLAVMAVEGSAPPVTLAPALDLVAVVFPPDWEAPVIRPGYTYLTTGPPVPAEAC
jgi:hypothetical protein